MLKQEIDFGKRSGLKIPRVNMGAMRIILGSMEEAAELVRYGIDKGMRYIETSRGYQDSEKRLALALKDGYRRKVILSTKNSPDHVRKYPKGKNLSDKVLYAVEDSMSRLEVDYLDFFQAWNIANSDVYKDVTAKNGFIEGVMRAKEKGLVRHTGFTTHDTVENLLRYIDEAEWAEAILVSYNILERDYEPVLKKAKAKGIATIVMNPVGGGRLTAKGSKFDEVVHMTKSDDLSDLALRYVLSNPDVDTLISGIMKKSDVDGSVRAADKPLLTPEEIKAVNQRMKELSPQNVKFCTACGYCMPCPNDVNIPHVMKAVYHWKHLGLKHGGKSVYAELSVPHVKGTNADACTLCGTCVSQCTQHINIPQEMCFARNNLNL